MGVVAHTSAQEKDVHFIGFNEKGVYYQRRTAAEIALAQKLKKGTLHAGGATLGYLCGKTTTGLSNVIAGEAEERLGDVAPGAVATGWTIGAAHYWCERLAQNQG